MTPYIVVVAGGQGSRMGASIPKQFLELAGKPILMHTLQQLHASMPDAHIVLVLPAEQREYWQQLCRERHFEVPHQLVDGGETRFHSVHNGLKALPGAGVVAIHDGVRPFVSGKVLRESFRLAQEQGGAVAVVQPKDSVRRLTPDGKSQAEDRSLLRLVQTPQTFRTELILEAFGQPYRPEFTDDASVAEAAGHTPALLEGNYENLKITTPEDLLYAQALLAGWELGQ